MTDPAATVTRSLSESDFAAVIALDGAAFGHDHTDEDVSNLALPLLRDARVIGSFEDARLVAVAAIQRKDLTFPGGVTSPVAAVTWVGVLPGEQGRGLLRGLMTNQLHGLHHEQAEPVAILTASEAGIYGRFGYGLAAYETETTMPNGLVFRPGVRVEPVRETDRAAAMPLLRSLYESVRSQRTGYLSRDEGTWSALYTDLPEYRRGAGSLRFGVHPEGVVAFRVAVEFSAAGPNHKLRILELTATSPTAAASLWHFVLNRAMIREISYLRNGPDEVLQDLLVNPRAVRAVSRDNLWLRIVDLDRAIPLRRYAERVQVVVRIVDRCCPWNEGGWHLDLSPAGGTATRSDAEPQLTIDIADLGSTLLGGKRLVRLAAAGLVTGTAVAIESLDRALATARAPYCPEGF